MEYIFRLSLSMYISLGGFVKLQIQRRLTVPVKESKPYEVPYDGNAVDVATELHHVLPSKIHLLEDDTLPEIMDGFLELLYIIHILYIVF